MQSFPINRLANSPTMNSRPRKFIIVHACFVSIRLVSTYASTTKKIKTGHALEMVQNCGWLFGILCEFSGLYTMDGPFFNGELWKRSLAQTFLCILKNCDVFRGNSGSRSKESLLKESHFSDFGKVAAPNCDRDCKPTITNSYLKHTLRGHESLGLILDTLVMGTFQNL